VRRTFRRCIAHLLSRADCFHFGDPFFDRFGFGLQIFQVRFQLGDSLCSRRKPSLEMNLRTFAALVATTLALLLGVTVAVAPAFFVMLSVAAPVTVTLAVMTVVTLVIFAVSAHVFHLLSSLNLAWSSNYSLPAPKIQLAIRRNVWRANLMRSFE
jgi:VIT1/CCC1 family predicted Fe2+/Mn2+ transporter